MPDKRTPQDAPTTTERLAELTAKMEIMTTDGDASLLTPDDIGDIYSWLLRAQLFASEELCECGQPRNSIRHSFATARSVDAHAFKAAER
jgi:hypothetical protein